MFAAKVAAVLAVTSIAVVMAQPYPVGTIISITDMDDQPNFANYLMRFDAANATTPLSIVNYPYYEDTTAGAIDLVRGRYLLMYEVPAQIGYYNLTTLAQIGTLNLPVQQLPDAMHYDATTDTVWLVEVGETSFDICSVDNTGVQTCHATVQGDFSYTADSSTYDAVNGKLYVQLANMDDTLRHPLADPKADNAQPLFVFDVASSSVSSPIPMIDLCLGMNTATFNGSTSLTCVDFITNLLVSVDTTTGKFHKLIALPGNPQPYTASVYSDAATGKATFYAELENFIGQSHWFAYDIASGAELTRTPVDGGYQLELPFFIPPNTF